MGSELFPICSACAEGSQTPRNPLGCACGQGGVLRSRGDGWEAVAFGGGPNAHRWIRSEHAPGGQALDRAHAEDVAEADGAQHGAVAEAAEEIGAGQL